MFQSLGSAVSKLVSGKPQAKVPAKAKAPVKAKEASAKTKEASAKTKEASAKTKEAPTKMAAPKKAAAPSAKNEKKALTAKPAAKAAVTKNAKAQVTAPAKPLPKGKAAAAPLAGKQGGKQKAPPKGQDFKKTVGQARTAMEKAAAPQHHHRSSANSSICREVACELMATTGGYCRMHYIKNWKRIKRKEMILKERKLNHYIEELVSKYPDKYIEAIRQDLTSEKDFSKVIADLEIDEALEEFETEGSGPQVEENLIDNLKRDFEDDGDVF